MLKAIYKRACKEGLAVAYKSQGAVYRFVKEIIALVLLPPDKFFEGYLVSNICIVLNHFLYCMLFYLAEYLSRLACYTNSRKI